MYFFYDILLYHLTYTVLRRLARFFGILWTRQVRGYFLREFHINYWIYICQTSWFFIKENILFIFILVTSISIKLFENRDLGCLFQKSTEQCFQDKLDDNTAKFYKKYVYGYINGSLPNNVSYTAVKNRQNS